MYIERETEEYGMINRAQEGNEEAMACMIEKYRPLIYAMSKRICCAYLEREELVQAGILGFIQAVKRYRVGFETRVSTYAVPWILGEMKKALRKQIESGEVLSLDRELSSDGYSLYTAVQGDVDIGVSYIDLRIALEKLEKEEQMLICLRYFRENTQKETAILLGKSQAQISRLERAALDRLHTLLA